MESREGLNDQNLKQEVYPNAEPKLTEEEVLRKKEKAGRCIISSGIEDEIVQEILNRTENGENFYCEIGGKRIYSIDLLKTSQERGCDLENAFYLLVYGKTKIEQDKVLEKFVQEKKLKEKKDRLAAIEKVPGRIEEGNKYIIEEKQKAWEDFVNYEAKTYNHGKYVKNVLNLLKMIDDGESWEKIQETFDNQEYTIPIYSYIKSRIVYFSKKGAEAEKNLNTYEC